MIKNYFKTAFRNLFKTPLLSFINITGLALGMAGAGLLLLNIYYEISIDQFHEKKDRVFKVYNKTAVNDRLICHDHSQSPLGPALQKEHPQIKQMARIAHTGKQFSYKDKKLLADGYYADAPFLSMFSFPLLAGSRQAVLNDQHAIVLTEKMAKKIFGDEDPLNKVIRLDNTRDVTVSGVLKDVPMNSSLKFEYLLPWEDKNNKWDLYFANTFIELNNAEEAGTVDKQIADIISRHSKNEQHSQVFLHPVGKMHLQGSFDEKGKPKTQSEIYFLSVLAVIMLLIGCINFMNLSTAHSGKRGKEVGVRKIMGAVKRSLIMQFITESTLLAFIAGCVGLLIVQMVWPTFSAMAKVRIEIPWHLPFFWLLTLTFILFTGILAGSYPAFYLSSFKPVKVLKGVFSNTGSLITPRRILVVVQFVLAIFLMNFAILFRKQASFTENRQMGFGKDELIFHSMTNDLRKNFEAVQQELMSTGLVSAICKSNSAITRSAGSLSGLEWNGREDNKYVSFSLFTSIGNFVKTNGLTLQAGRDIDYNNYKADNRSCVINESAAKELGFANPVGQTIKEDDHTWTIIGVVKDFYQSSPGDLAKPVMIRYGTDDGTINIRMQTGSISLQGIRTVEEIIKKNNPGYITELQFADEDVARTFQQRKNASNLINSFTLIAIFIACMGLLGLTAYMVEMRRREVGIRKVLGASVAKVTTILAIEFVKLVGISVLIASPLAWLFMNYFLQQFSYRTTISWWILPVTGIIALVIEIAKIILQKIKTAVANPVNALRSE
jgi:ABC-type antimicrobial peptide transport system permease subunit